MNYFQIQVTTNHHHNYSTVKFTLDLKINTKNYIDTQYQIDK
jgi:hypothetical protein